MILRRVIKHVRGQKWTAVVINFFIVVGGVYSAVWVEGIQGRSVERQRMTQVIKTLHSDLQDSTAVERGFDSAIIQGLETWEQDFAAGKLPPPYFFRVPGSDTAPQNMWDTLLNMKLGELFHPDLVFDLAFYYSERDGAGRKYIRYVTFVENEILPRMKDDVSEFYIADKSRLKPKFAANMDRLRDWRRESYANIVWAECLNTRLDAPNTAGASCARQFDVEISESENKDGELK